MTAHPGVNLICVTNRAHSWSVEKHSLKHHGYLRHNINNNNKTLCYTFLKVACFCDGIIRDDDDVGAICYGVTIKAPDEE